MIDLNPKHLKTIQSILAEYIPAYEVRAFGSRVKWTAKDYSDLDLAVVGNEPLSLRQRGQLVDAFEESNLPIRVDVLDWQSISERFRQVILERYEVIQKAKPVNQNGNSKGINGNWSTKREWQVKIFGDCATLIRESVSPSDLGNTPYVGLEHIGESTLSLVGIGVESDVTSTKSRFREGDILFGKLRCYFRKVVRAPFDGVCSTDIWVTRAKEEVDQGFLYYCMASQSFVDFADSGSIGTRMPRAKWEWVSRYKIHLPPLQEQRHIAHILGTLDNKIELNRHMNETLEATARAIFKSWFVDFDPVKAKMEGRKPACMDTETAALFPSALQDSPLGKIPEGWNIGTLGEIAKNVRKNIKASEIDSNECFIGLEHMPRRSIALSQWQVDAEIASNKYRFKQGEILFGKLNPHFHKVGVAPIDGICSTDILVIQPIDAEWFGFVLSLVSSDNFVAYTKAFSKGTTLPRTNWKDMSSYKTVLPKVKIARKYTEFIRPIVKRIIENIHECHTLSQTRDALLPKLLSGEIRVDTAAEILEVEDDR